VGLADMIDNGRNGVLYPRGDVGVLADLLVRYAGDDAARTALERSVVDTGVGRCDIRALADEHVRVWQRPELR